MNQNPPIVEINNVSFRYDRDPVLEDVSLQVDQGQFVGVVGPNGGGKTTLLKMMLGFLQPDSGSIRVFGKPPNKVVSLIGYVPQYSALDLEFPISVIDVVLMGLLGSSPQLGRYSKSDKQTAENVLSQVEMADLRNRQFGELSGGQRQRVLIARALAGNPKLLIMDEPTSHVDSLSQKQIFNLLQQINQHCTIIVVSHDLSIVPIYVTQVACLNHSLVIHPTKELTIESLETMYHTPMQFVDHGHEIE